MTKNRRTQDKALKQEADRLVFEESRKKAEVVHNLGIGKEIVIRSVKEFQKTPYTPLSKISISKDGFRLAFNPPPVKNNHCQP